MNYLFIYSFIELGNEAPDLALARQVLCCCTLALPLFLFLKMISFKCHIFLRIFKQRFSWYTYYISRNRSQRSLITFFKITKYDPLVSTSSLRGNTWTHKGTAKGFLMNKCSSNYPKKDHKTILLIKEHFTISAQRIQAVIACVYF